MVFGGDTPFAGRYGRAGQNGAPPHRGRPQETTVAVLFERWSARRNRILNRRAARAAARMPAAAGFVSQPEPRSMGHVARGRQIMAGNLLFEGYLVIAPGVTEGTSIWEVQSPHPDFEAALHGFGWLDDLAALGDGAARARAQHWLSDWIARFGGGDGPGWLPDLAGRRLIRWIHHAPFLLSGMPRDGAEAFFRAVSVQAAFIDARAAAAAPGLARFEALTGLLYAGLSLIGAERHVTPAAEALGRDCAAQIDEHGGIASRNPEELLEIFTLLVWAAQALDGAGGTPQAAHARAITGIAETLRSLRHADGGLARFHGGGQGAPGQLDQALAASGTRPSTRGTQAMGFARMAGGRTSVIVDAAPPPLGAASARAHASTLAFELTSGRRPLVVNCGAGAPFGLEWRRAGRATASHSTLAIEGYSSSRLARAAMGDAGGEWLAEAPRDVTVERTEDPQGQHLALAHDGYAATHGLIHLRNLALSRDGRALMGDDSLVARTPEQAARFARLLDATGLQGVRFAIRFHLHPDVDATLDMGGKAVSLALRSGEIWVFRAEGVPIALEPSVYLEKGRVAPRPAQQIVLATAALEPDHRVTWSLSKAQETPVALRDTEYDDPMADDTTAPPA
jgi:uncharacterized heparinase superfamily protein